MNYEFHVGDYVEANDGHIGYISGICTCDKCKERGWCEPNIKYTDGTEDYISNYDVESIPDSYIRIGAYDFTKKEKKKIVKLSEDDSWLIFRNTNKANVNLCYIVKRINELVDAVNLLLDKSTES